MELDFKEAFTYMFEDKRKFWLNYIILFLLNLLSIIPAINAYSDSYSANYATYNINFYLNYLISLVPCIFMIGYIMFYANQRVVTGSNVLPCWKENFKNITLTGLKYFVGLFLLCLISYIMFFLKMVVSIIMALIPVAIVSGGMSTPTAPMMAAISCAITALSFVPLIILYFCAFALLAINFVRDLKISSFLNINRAISLLKHNWINCLMLLIAFMLIIPFTSMLYALLACKLFVVYAIVGSICGPYIGLVFYNLVAQFVKLGIEKNQK